MMSGARVNEGTDGYVTPLGILTYGGCGDGDMVGNLISPSNPPSLEMTLLSNSNP